jgi:hypothetical protein
MIRSAACRGESVPAAGGSAAWPRRLGRRHEVTDERRHPAERDLDVLAPAQLEDRERVLGDLPPVDVAGAARHGDDLRVRRGAREEEGEAVVDPRVDVDQQRDDVAGQHTSSARSRTTSGMKRFMPQG